MLKNTYKHFNFDIIHSSWGNCIKDALSTIDKHYLQILIKNNEWLPGKNKIFNAFSTPLNSVKYVLFGESPYPRPESANGYAFWDENVTNLWSDTGLSKPVNKATSMRNIIKMLLVAENLLCENNTTQENISSIDKKQLVQTNSQLFNNILGSGFLLLNATPVLQKNNIKKDAQIWQPFNKIILNCIHKHNRDVHVLLLGGIAKAIDKLTQNININKIYSEHPYNISFIKNKKIINFFRELHLLINK
ncbi:uracil-DNA glycosylase [Gammaproteobacteria bacterium]|nr:uracil-DNA glycosylase [Gammaproteobacteria bacterium]